MDGAENNKETVSVAEKMIDSNQSVYQTVYDMFEVQVSEHAPSKLAKVAADTPLDDIGMDSLEKLSVAMDLEQHYDVLIPDEDIEAFVTIKDVADYLEKALAEKEEKALSQDDQKTVEDQQSQSDKAE